MGNYKFKDDLEVAKATEKEIALLLQNKYNANIIGFEDSNKYDILAEMKGKEFTFEIKEDLMCEKTGNVSLEFEYRGKPSGISVSQADFYIYKIHAKDGIKYVLHPTGVLKKMVEDKLYFRVVSGGDPGSNTMNYLFKYDTFAGKGKILDA